MIVEMYMCPEAPKLTDLGCSKFNPEVKLDAIVHITMIHQSSQAIEMLC
jgi:hypothetical protein